MSGMFLAITVTLRVTGLPGTAKMPPPVAALLRVTWLNLMVSGPPAAGPLLAAGTDRRAAAARRSAR